MILLGVDPGGVSTGLVVRDGPRVLAAELVTSDSGKIDEAYLSDVLGALTALYAQGCRVVAVEGLNHPSPHLGIANLDGLLGTAQVLGAIRTLCVIDGIRCVVVGPGGHGSAPLRSYPAELVGAREKRGAGKMRHLRSAFDIAGVGVVERSLLERSLLEERSAASV